MTNFEILTNKKNSASIDYQLLTGFLLYSEPGSNRYGHYCPQDFKSGVSTYSTIRATQSPKRRVQMYDFIFILPNILPRTWELYLTPITNAEIKHHPKSARPLYCQKSRDMGHRKRIHPGIVQLVQPRVECLGMCRRLRLITTKSLFVLTCLKAHNLILCKETPSTTLKVFLSKTCIVYTVELLH